MAQHNVHEDYTHFQGRTFHGRYLRAKIMFWLTFVGSIVLMLIGAFDVSKRPLFVVGMLLLMVSGLFGLNLLYNKWKRGFHGRGQGYNHGHHRHRRHRHRRHRY